MSKPIPAKVWKNHYNGRTASVRGAVPYHSAAEAAEWTIVDVGWTVQHPDGTTGICRPPFATREEAQAWCDAHPNFPGMSQG